MCFNPATTCLPCRISFESSCQHSSLLLCCYSMLFDSFLSIGQLFAICDHRCIRSSQLLHTLLQKVQICCLQRSMHGKTEAGSTPDLRQQSEHVMLSCMPLSSCLEQLTVECSVLWSKDASIATACRAGKVQPHMHNLHQQLSHVHRPVLDLRHMHTCG